MATWSGFFRHDAVKRSGMMASGAGYDSIRAQAIHVQNDPFRLRSLPNDDIYFFAKTVDNSKVVRQMDPAARGEVASAMAAAVLLMVLAVSIIMPKAAWMLEGYKLEALKSERQTLLDQKRELEVREASLLSPERLADLAKASNLTNPGQDQIIHLEAQGDAHMAANRAATPVGNVVGGTDSSAATRSH